jgi:hypothetical protein
MSGEEVLGLSGRFEALHLPLSSSRWSMDDGQQLHAIYQEHVEAQTKLPPQMQQA